MEALFVSGDGSDLSENNTSNYRIHNPAKYLSLAGHSIDVQKMPGLSLQNGDKAYQIDHLDYSTVQKVVLFERNLTPERVEKMRLMGAKRIVATFDDHYGLIPPYMGSAKYWADNYRLFTKTLGLVDLVIVPSMKLLNEFKSYCREIKYVPNYLDPELWAEPLPAERKKIIGWGGSSGHVESWKSRAIVRALEEVLDENPDWKLRLFGNMVPQELINHDQVEVKPWVRFADWPLEVNEFSIGIAPLMGNYDSFRSNLKLVEYCVSAVPWIASYAAPYTNPPMSVGGYLARDKDWYELLTLLMTDDHLRLATGQAGYTWGKGWFMDKHVEEYERLLWGTHV